MENTFHDDILQPIQNDKLLQLRDLYSKNWPEKIFIYYYIDMCYSWITKYNSDINFYSVEGNYEDGTFIVLSDKKIANVVTIAFFTLEKSNKRLYTGLSKTHRINWNKTVHIHIAHKDQIPIACDVARQNQLHLNYITPAGYWWIPKQKASLFQIEIPNNTYIGPLSEEHVDKINYVWPYRSDSSRNYIETLIKNNNGIGLFDKNDNTLLAWIMRNNYGALGILQTDENHKRKGYATIVTKALCKQFAENNIDPICFIVVGNTVSETLFKNLGFEVIDYMCWMKMVKI